MHEAQGRGGLMRQYMRPIYPGARIAGNAVTILAQPNDNWMLHVAMEVLREGDVVVVGVVADCVSGMFGELLATSMQQRGVQGLVIDAGCRDVRPLTEMAFPVWSKVIFAQGTVKASLGAVNEPIVCAGVSVLPGDVVVADDDGVVVIPLPSANEVAEAGKRRAEREEEIRVRLAAGELGLDIYGMRPALKEKGLRYLEGPFDWRASAKDHDTESK